MGLIEEAMGRREDRRTFANRTRPIKSSVSLRPDVDLSTVRRIEPDDAVIEASRLVSESMDPAAIGAYKMLRTQVFHKLRAKGWSSIGLSTARSGEGKTLTAINLALSLALNPDQHVFLVDFDLRRHCMGAYLGLPDCGGLMEALEGGDLNDHLLRYGNQRVYALLNNQTIEHSSEILASDDVRNLVHRLRAMGGIVIYDLPPLLSADDYLAFAEHIDCTLFVISEGETQRADVLRAREMIDEEKLLGVVLNKSKERTLEDGYYYSD